MQAPNIPVNFDVTVPLALGNDLAAEEFVDSHGNHVCRVTLAHGTNSS